MKRPLLLALLVAAVGTFQSAVHVSGATVERKVRQVEPNIGCTAAGFFVHPNDCKRFYRCVDFFGTGERFSIFFFDCPAGTIFDESLSVCNHPEWVMGPLNCMGGGNPPSTTSVPDSSSVESSTNPVTDLPVTAINPPDASVEPTSPPFINPEPTNAPSTSVEPTNPPFTNPAPTNSPVSSVEPTNPPFTNPAPTIPPVTTPAPTNPTVTTPAPTNPPVTSPIPPMSSPEPTNPPFTNPEPTNPPATIPVQTNTPPTAAPVTLAPSTEAPVITSATSTNPPVPNPPVTNPPVTTPPPTTSQSTESPLTTLPTIAPNTMVFPTEAPATNPPPTTSQSTLSPPTTASGAIVFPTEAPETSTASPATTTAAPFVLTCGSKKFYRHPLRCDLYYQCLWSGVFNINILSCPQGTNFDEDSSTCLPPDQTKPCQVMEWSTTQPLPTTPTTTPTAVSQQFTLAPGSLYECKRPGHFPYELDCIRFYRCFEVQPGVLKGLLYRCPSGYGYDSKVTQRCQKQQSLPPVCDRSDLVRSGSIPIPIIPLEDTTAVRIEDLESFFRNVNSFYLPRG